MLDNGASRRLWDSGGRAASGGLVIGGRDTDLLMAAEAAWALGRYRPGADIEIENLQNLIGGGEPGG